MIYCKNGHNYKDNLFSVCAECLSWNVSLYLKLWSTCLVFKVSQERPFMVFSCHVSRWFQFQVFYWALKVPFKYNATSFLYFWLTKLYDMSQVTSFLTGFLFHMSITVNFIISGCLCNIVDVTFNRISSWFHNS